MKDTTTCVMRAALQQKKSIRRDIEIRSTDSLYDLAEAVVAAFGFDFDHAFGFYSGKTARTLMSAEPRYELFADIGEDSDAQSVKRTRIAQAFPQIGHTLTMLFDYGDEWLFRVERIGTGERVPRARYPKAIASAGAAPEQYPDLADE